MEKGLNYGQILLDMKVNIRMEKNMESKLFKAH
jgi:hypothetical protein